mmetsp:Transcript_52283/g.122411  ORF Transcript_52283/g.122411 Transcript_52283/m.122411 type:complete len:416 (+) Transcript_52283:52-1299(+)
MIASRPGDLGDVFSSPSCGLAEYYASMSHDDLCRRLMGQDRELLSLQMTLAPMKAENVKLSRSLKQSRQQLEVILQVLFSFFGSPGRQEWLNQKWRLREKEDKDLVEFFARLLRWHNAIRADTDATVSFYQKLWRYDTAGGIFQHVATQRPDEMAGEDDLPMPEPEQFLEEVVQVSQIGAPGAPPNAASQSRPFVEGPDSPEDGSNAEPAAAPAPAAPALARPTEQRVSPIPLPMLERLTSADPLWRKVANDVDRLIHDRNQSHNPEDAAPETGATSSPGPDSTASSERYLDYLADVIWLLAKHEPTFTNAIQLAKTACGPKWSQEVEASMPASMPTWSTQQASPSSPGRSAAAPDRPRASQWRGTLSRLIWSNRKEEPSRGRSGGDVDTAARTLQVPNIPPPSRPEPARRRMNL